MKKILFGFLFLSVNSYADTYYQYNGCLKLTITNSSSEFDSQENQYILHEVEIGKRNIDACRNFRPFGAYYLEEKKQSGLLIIGKLISKLVVKSPVGRPYGPFSTIMSKLTFMCLTISFISADPSVRSSPFLTFDPSLTKI